MIRFLAHSRDLGLLLVTAGTAVTIALVLEHL